MLQHYGFVGFSGLAKLTSSNGRVLLCLGAGLEKSQFKRSILQTLDKLLSPSENTDHVTEQQPTDSVPSSESTLAEPEHDPALSLGEDTAPQPRSVPQSSSLAPTPSATSPPTSSSSPAMASTSSSRIHDMLAERRQRLEKDKKDKETAEKAERKVQAESRREAINTNPSSAKAKQADYAKQQQKRNQEAKLERERILRDIENNKAERKEKEKRRKALAKLEAEGNDGAEGLVDQQLAREVLQPQQKSSNECAIQVRLFDGSTIRHGFPVEQSLRSHVRRWIGEQGLDGDTPYNFKQILTPMQNRTISISDEEESLQTLGLTPSATLVMVPVQGYAAAYAGSQSIFSRCLSAAYSIINSGLGVVTRALGTFIGIGGTANTRSGAEAPSTADQESPSQRGVVDTGPKINVRTLRDEREDHDDHQFYNGNQVCQMYRRTTLTNHIRSLISNHERKRTRRKIR